MTPAYFAKDSKPSLPKKPAPLPRESARKAAARAATGERKFSTIPKSGKPRPVGRNKERQAREFARTFHSVERVEFVRSLPCFATGIRGQSDNAHVARDGSEGMGRRGGYRCIAPLIRSAHRLLHRDAEKFAALYGEFDWDAAAAWTEQQWQKCAGGAYQEGK